MTATLVRFPNEVLERIDRIAGIKQRAKFIRDAVDAELDRRENPKNKNNDYTKIE